ncbi:hypothetical protein [Clostridium formicaceticum]|uniref:CGNR zinc finger domain-containing protein n=1 Tax=Clostridium formicaceticum TaxID=1497 RepID=A0AAC9RRN9_9CLOT|nr:hypothetical protein [Clostridium formicaceticum]AOY75286.1 hypothetical protein BJL90_04820 [Clostridium formicaceticum]ARE89725.1 hypothetical protein CLFO_42060 [Clostridium formicaceticum]
MEGKIGLIGSFATDWIRYSDYQFKTAYDGEVYIIPAEEATFCMYNPFDVAEDLLMDLMKIGDKALKIQEEIDREELNKDLLIFARKYGLLGFISASAYNRNIVGEDKVLMIENNYITKEKIMDANEFIDKFIPFAKEGEVVFKQYRDSIDVMKREDSPKFYGKRPIVMDLIFSKFYSEQINWIVNFAKMISSHFNQLLIYRNSSSYLTEKVTIMAEKFGAEKIGFTISQLDKTMIAWEFDSLKTAIETIYAFAVTDETTLINRCSHCNSIFISSNARAKYCSPSCRNCANVQKCREKNAANIEDKRK